MRVKHKQTLNERDRLEKFLCWLLDPRWFPTIDKQFKKDTTAQLRTLRSILKRMETFTRRSNDVRLQRGLHEWKNYAQDLQQICRNTIRRSPIMQTASRTKAETVVSERLLCASLIIPRLWNDGSTYRKMKELLEQPSKLKCDTASQGYIEMCRRINGEYLIQPVPYARSEKALQSLIQRMRANIRRRRSPYANDLDVLHHVYGQYCWLSLGQSGFTDSEADMLLRLAGGNTDRQKPR